MKTTQFNFSKLISNAKYLGVAALFIGGLATFSGCATKGCTDETADNYDEAATEDDGSCIPARDKFLRTASAVEDICGVNTYNYTTDIVAGDAANEIKIKNLGNYNCTGGDYYVVATVDLNTLTIATQNQCSTTFEGTGTYNTANNKVVITYSATYDPGTGVVTDNCVATFE